MYFKTFLNILDVSVLPFFRDLSDNKFSGIIPNSLGQLVDLQNLWEENLFLHQNTLNNKKKNVYFITVNIPLLSYLDFFRIISFQEKFQFFWGTLEILLICGLLQFQPF